MNIVSNAAESIEDKGVIEITSFNEDNHITIKISDTGSGIPESIKLFEPFQTTKLLSGHAGIGLFISKKIIEMRGGRISCSSESNRGTTVTIILPAA
jgi:signal transduction histidine kinase